MAGDNVSASSSEGWSANIPREVSFSPDGLLVAVWGRHVHTIRLMEVQTWKHRGTIETKGCVHVLFHPSSQLIVGEIKAISIWDVDSLKKLHGFRYTGSGLQKMIMSAARMLAVVLWRGSLRRQPLSYSIHT